jgi:hypothetical protein
VAGVDAWRGEEQAATVDGTRSEVGLWSVGRSILGRMRPMALSRGSVRGKDLLFG